MLDRTPTDSGSRESELLLDEVMVFVAKLVVVSGICRCTTYLVLLEQAQYSGPSLIRIAWDQSPFRLVKFSD